MELKKIKMQKKKAALEISMTTIVTIVLTVVFLILALIILRRMYGFQTEAIGSVQEKTLDEINKLYLGEEHSGSRIFVQLGSDKKASIRAGTDNFGIEIGAGTRAGQLIQNKTQLQFYLELDPESPCYTTLGKTTTESFFKTKLNTWLNSETFGDAAGGIIVYVGIPPGTRTCIQKVYVQARDNTGAVPDVLGQEVFSIEVLRKSPLG